MAKVNGVITLSEWERAEKADDLMFNFDETELGKKLWNNYKISKDNDDFKKYIEEMHKYVREHINQ